MPHKIPSLGTTRLLLPPMELADVPQIQAIFPRWEIVKYLNGQIPWRYPASGAETFFRETALPARERGEGWLWTIQLKSAPETIMGAIRLTKNAHENRGFWLDARMHGQALMTEAGDAVTDFCFEVLNFPVADFGKTRDACGSSERNGITFAVGCQRSFGTSRQNHGGRARRGCRRRGTRDEQA